MQGPRSKLSRILKVVFLQILLLLALPALARALDLTFDSHAVTADGLAPGTPVAWLWTGRAIEGFSTRVELGSEAGHSDRAGSTRLESARELPEQSIWALADLSTGELVVEGPEASRASLLELPLEGLERDRLTMSGRRFEVLLVRPGVGAWRAEVRDGDATDFDGERNAGVTLLATSLEPLGETAAVIDSFEPGDRLLLADPDHLRLWAAALDRETFANLPTNTSR